MSSSNTDGKSSESQKSEAKGKSWRREREERGRRQQQQKAESSEKIKDDVIKVPGESKNPKEWGKGWDKSISMKEENTEKKEGVKDVEEASKEEVTVTNVAATEADEDPHVEAESEKDKMEEELRILNEYVNDNKERIRGKEELRRQNQSVSRPEENFFSKLDSSLKKNTAFVKRLRNLTEAQKESLIKDFHGLNLSKYISEAAVAIVEAKLKLSDVNCGIVICSLLHQRYAEFTPLLLENWQKILPLKKEEKVSNPSKVRVDLRFFAELISCGVFTQKEGLPVLGNLLTVLTSGDKEEHKNLNIILSFCKHCGEDYAGLMPRNIRILNENHNIELPRNMWLPAERQKGLRTLLKDYYKSICRHLVSSHKELQNMSIQNNRILHTKGEVSAERTERFESMQEAFQKLTITTQSFSDLFDEDMPNLPTTKLLDDEDDGQLLDITNRFKDSEGDGDGFSLWEDDDTRSFYESLQDLKAFIPGILFKDSIQVAQKTEEEGGATVAASVLEEDMSKLDLVDDMITMVDTLDETSNAEAKNDSTDSKQTNVEADIVNALIPDVEDTEEEVEPETNVSSTVSANKILLDAFLSSLSNCINRELIDKAAVEFCMNLNTKPNRKKLVRTLFAVHRTRLDLLPFYSRLVATLHPCMPEVSIDLCTMIKQDFKYHVRKKDQINIESKVKTARFIGELVKFRMFPKSDALYCLKILLFDFSHHQIEMACNLLETCGRFLFRSLDSHQRTKVYLDQMMRKKSVMNLNSRYVTMIENAFYYCNPPDVVKVVKKERPPMHLYIRKLLYKELTKANVEKILRQFRKLNWDDEDVTSYAVKCLVASWNVRYLNIRCVANLLAGLTPYRDNVAPRVVDGILEDVRICMEINHPKFNQRRVSAAKFLGELYNYRMVESAVIFKILYSFITFGVFYDGVDSDIDPPESLFRIKLICVLLDTCGQYFNSGSSKKKLDFYVGYFQRYFWYKKSQPFYSETNIFPITMEYLVKDTLASIRPKLKLFESYEEAVKAVAEMEKEVMNKIIHCIPSLKTRFNESEHEAAFESDGLAPIEEVADEDEALLEQEDEVQELGESDEDDDESENHSQDVRDRHASGTQDTDGIFSSSQENEVEGTVPGGPKHIQCTEDEDFMTAFDKMLADSIQHRNQEVVKPPQVDISVPIHIRPAKKVHIQSPMEPESPLSDVPNMSESPKSTTSFVLMTRKGNKQQYKSLEVPLDSELVLNLKYREKAEKAEKERVKRLTLDINERQEEEDYQEMLASLQRPATICNLNRERGKPKFYQHPKGAPDADAIFGNRKR